MMIQLLVQQKFKCLVNVTINSSYFMAINADYNNYDCQRPHQRDDKQLEFVENY
jgi:hypothetical protein